MRIVNVHHRFVPMHAVQAGALVDGLSGDGDALWPRAHWPALRLDRGLQPGSRGGHGPIRYTVERYEPGVQVVFRFDPAMGMHGTHTFRVEPAPHGCVLRHVIDARATGSMRIAWPLAIRWLHDALVEDAFDQAVALATCTRAPLPSWSLHVRALRGVLRAA